MSVTKRILGLSLIVGLGAASACGDTVKASGGDGMEDGILTGGTASGTVHIYDRATLQH